MKLKVISDGHPRGATVINAETGEEIEGVTMVVWHSKPGHLPTVTIKLIDVEVHAAEFQGPKR